MVFESFQIYWQDFVEPSLFYVQLHKNVLPWLKYSRKNFKNIRQILFIFELFFLILKIALSMAMKIPVWM